MAKVLNLSFRDTYKSAIKVKTYDKYHLQIFFFDLLLRIQIIFARIFEIGFIPISIF